MPLRSLSVRGYRSIHRLFLRLGQVNVIVGPNGVGKSNLYRSLYLLTAAAEGRLARTLAQEGGMPSALWAGELSKGHSKRISVEIGFDQWSYRLECGLPKPNNLPLPDGSAFQLDPFMRVEELEFHDAGRRSVFVSRANDLANVRDDDGQRVRFPLPLASSESIMSELREPRRYPELFELRSVLMGWRFYHQFRTDADSGLRRPQIAVRTPVLTHDGSDLAAALQTIVEEGDREALAAAVAAAFDGGRLEIRRSAGGLEATLETSEFRRPFGANELSDETLKYLCLLAALLSTRPPTLLAINEPDASLHPQLYKPLADLIALSARHSQLWITTHSQTLADLLEQKTGARLIRLQKHNGSTLIVDDDLA